MVSASAWSNQTKPNIDKPDQTKLRQTKPDQTKLNQIKPANPEWFKSLHDSSPNLTEPNDAHGASAHLGPATPPSRCCNVFFLTQSWHSVLKNSLTHTSREGSKQTICQLWEQHCLNSKGRAKHFQNYFLAGPNNFQTFSLWHQTYEHKIQEYWEASSHHGCLRRSNQEYQYLSKYAQAIAFDQGPRNNVQDYFRRPHLQEAS